MTARNTKLKPAPLRYPNGGGIKAAMRQSKGVSPAVTKTAKEALLAKHAAEKAKFEDTHGPQEWS
jgi:hypothetical protein